MTIRKAVITVCGCALVGGIAGITIGYCIGYFLPDAYQTMFRPTRPDFSPTAVGIALGLPQGIFFGTLVGVAIVAIVTWYEIRMMEAKQRSEPPFQV